MARNNESSGAAAPPPQNPGEGAEPQTSAAPVLKPGPAEPTTAHSPEAPLVLRRGEVEVAVIKDGQEVPGSSFVTTEATAKKYYSNPDKFAIKKKA